MTYDKLTKSGYFTKAVDLGDAISWEVKDEFEITTIAKGDGTGPLSDENVRRIEYQKIDGLDEYWMLHTEEGSYTYDMNESIKLYVVQIIRKDIGVVE